MLVLDLDVHFKHSRRMRVITCTSQVSMGADGGSNALSTENGCTLQNFSDFIDTYSARGFKRVVGGVRKQTGVGSNSEILHVHGIHVSVACRSPSPMLDSWSLNA